jgi:DNA transposition AAA+ family ATPase
MTPFDKYSPDDIAACQQIDAWLKANDQTRAWLGRLARVSPATVSQVINGNYPTNPAEHLTAMQDAITQDTARSAAVKQAGGYVVTSITDIVRVVCDRSRAHRNFGLVTGNVGVGKTAALKWYISQRKHTVLLEADPDMTPGVMLTDLLAALGAACPRSLAEKFSCLVAALEKSSILLLIDEAETMQPRCLHYLRRIRDKAGVGIVLCGTGRLQQLVGAERGAFDQIHSRTGMSTKLIKTITEADHNTIARVALAEHDPSEAVLKVMWQYSRGSARMLTENLIPALRDFGLGKSPLSVGMVKSVVEAAL